MSSYLMTRSVPSSSATPASRRRRARPRGRARDRGDDRCLPADRLAVRRARDVPGARCAGHRKAALEAAGRRAVGKADAPACKGSAPEGAELRPRRRGATGAHPSRARSPCGLAQHLAVTYTALYPPRRARRLPRATAPARARERSPGGRAGRRAGSGGRARRVPADREGGKAVVGREGEARHVARGFRSTGTSWGGRLATAGAHSLGSLLALTDGVAGRPPAC